MSKSNTDYVTIICIVILVVIAAAALLWAGNALLTVGIITEDRILDLIREAEGDSVRFMEMCIERFKQSVTQCAKWYP